MSDFADFVVDVFADWAPVRARTMFGGHGLYRDALMFALVADDVLYLKADEASADAFDALGLPPFEYEKGGRTTRMSYRRAPDTLFDDPEEARRWAELAWQAALRGRRR